MPLLILAAAAAAAILPPPLRTVPVYPPGTTYVPMPPYPGRPLSRTIRFAVTVRRGDTRLWDGRLTMATGANASFSQRSEETVACTAATTRDGLARLSTGFTLTLSGGYGTDTVIHAQARLDRAPTDASPTALCADQTVRSIEVQSNFVPENGKAMTISGDAGLSVTLVPSLDAG